MKTKTVNIEKLLPNEENPRVIKTGKFKKLMQSVKDFPEMLELRPIVVDEDYKILGGNMRYRACLEAKIKEVPITIAKDLTEEQKAEFIIKDNVGFGEWDWDIMANNWDAEKLNDWGLDLVTLNDKAEIEEQEIVFSEYLEESNNYVVLMFDNDIDWLSAQTHFNLKSVHSKRQNGKAWSKGIGRVVNGADYLKGLKDE